VAEVEPNCENGNRGAVSRISATSRLVSTLFEYVFSGSSGSALAQTRFAP
jgi:hypothetical protein